MNLTDIYAVRLQADVRKRIIINSHKTKTPHLGSCLSCIDILVALYYYILRIDPKDSTNPLRDRFILSKGHAAPALYQVLAIKGFYPESLLDDYGKNGSYFAEHPPAPGCIPGIEAVTGSLGHGLPIGVGMALAAKIRKQDYRVYVLLSDGECNEGSVWEAALFASAKQLNNLTVIVDYNKWQATGRSNEIMKLEPLLEKFKSFGFHGEEIDGHKIPILVNKIKEIETNATTPSIIIANTIKGCGVSFMEDDNNWHYRIPTAQEVELACRELSC